MVTQKVRDTCSGGGWPWGLGVGLAGGAGGPGDGHTRGRVLGKSTWPWADRAQQRGLPARIRGGGGHATGGGSQQGVSEAPAHPPVGGKALLQLLQDQGLHHVICFCHQVRGRRFR